MAEFLREGQPVGFRYGTGASLSDCKRFLDYVCMVAISVSIIKQGTAEGQCTSTDNKVTESKTKGMSTFSAWLGGFTKPEGEKTFPVHLNGKF